MSSNLWFSQPIPQQKVSLRVPHPECIDQDGDRTTCLLRTTICRVSCGEPIKWKTHSPGSVCDWLDAPELRMLRWIYRLLAAAEPDRNGPGVPEERALLYRLWRVIS